MAYRHGHEHGTRTQRQPKGTAPWYAALDAENLAKVEAEWQERDGATAHVSINGPEGGMPWIRFDQP